MRAASGGDLGQVQGIYIRMRAADARYWGLLTSLFSGLLSVPMRMFPSKTKTLGSKLFAALAQDMLRYQWHSNFAKSLATLYLTSVSIFGPGVPAAVRGRIRRRRPWYHWLGGYLIETEGSFGLCARGAP